MTDQEKNVIVEFLCGSALADHLGDVRNAEVKLWKLLGVESRDIEEADNAFDATKATLKKHGIALPKYFQ